MISLEAAYNAVGIPIEAVMSCPVCGKQPEMRRVEKEHPMFAHLPHYYFAVCESETHHTQSPHYAEEEEQANRHWNDFVKTLAKTNYVPGSAIK